MPDRAYLPAVLALWRREMLTFVRDRSRVVGALAQPVAFWLLLGLGFAETFRLPGAETLGYLEYLAPGILALILLFTAIFSTISVVEDRQRGFLQAALVAPVPRTALVLGHVFGGTTLAVAQGLLLLLVLPLMGLPLSLTGLLVVVLAGTLAALGFTALGFVIAWRTETTRGFHAVMNLLLIPLWLLSGAVFPAEGASPVLRWLIRLNPVSYAVSALRQGLYLPAAPPLALAPISVCLAVSMVFAVGLLVLAVAVVRRPLFS